MIYDYLFELDDTGEATSNVLESWKWVSDTTLELVLKDNVYFSDGTQVTGDDIIFTLYSFIEHNSATMELYQHIDFDASYVDEDGLTVYLEYTSVYGPYLTALQVPIMSEAYCAEHPEDDPVWRFGPVGSGPYEVTDTVQDSYTVFSLREDYWNGTDQYDCSTITVYYYSDITTMFAEFQNGNLDIALGLSDTQVQQMNSGSVPGSVVLQSSSDNLLLCFNESCEALTDPVVREAIAYAVDWDAVGVAAFGSLCQTATSHFASNMAGYYVEHNVYSYDPDYAAEILAEAGYSDGDIQLVFIGTEVANHGVVGETIQFYLDEVGIDLSVETFDLSTMLSRFMEGYGDLSLQSLAGSGGNPDHEPNLVVSAMDESNFPTMRITDPEFNELVRAGVNTVDFEERCSIYQQIDDYLYDNYLAIPICEQLEAYAKSDRVADGHIESVNGCFLQYVEMN